MRKDDKSLHTAYYRSFRGVDFATDPTAIAPERSGEAVNIFSGADGCPEKRTGWRTVKTYSARVNGVFSAVFGGVTHRLAHVGDKLYRWYEKESENLYSHALGYASVQGGVQYAVAGACTAVEFAESLHGERQTVTLDDEASFFCEADGFVFLAGSDGETVLHTQGKLLYSGLADCKSTAVYLLDALYIFGGNKLLRYAGGAVADAADDAYVPTVKIACSPDGTGGTTHENINLLTPRQRIGFIADGTSTVYRLPYESVESIDFVEVNGNSGTAARLHVEMPRVPIADRFYYEYVFEYSAQRGRWGYERSVYQLDGSLISRNRVKAIEGTAPTNLTEWNITLVGTLQDGDTVYRKAYLPDTRVADGYYYAYVGAENTYTAYPAEGKVVFNRAPAAPEEGQADNVFITCTHTTQGSYERVAKCKTAIAWGVGGASDRLVASGNPDYPNQIFVSDFQRGNYFPDLNYAAVGTKESRVRGFMRRGEYLAICKETCGAESTLYLRSGELDENGNALFRDFPAISGVGAVSDFGTGHIGTDTLLLTDRGVMALTTDSLTEEKNMQNRSFRIDPRLLRENLQEAVCASANDCFYIFVGGKVYGLDGRQSKSYPGGSTLLGTNFLYECFYWDNIPARCVCADGDTIWFGTEEGKICRFNDDCTGAEQYNDDGAAICAVWATRADDDGDPARWKSLLRHGNSVTLKDYTHTGAKLFIRTERDCVPLLLKTARCDRFAWDSIDFCHFSFLANDAPRDVAWRPYLRPYRRLQIIVKNDAVDEGFGVLGIVKHYVLGKPAGK